jgi:hypothetical protein
LSVPFAATSSPLRWFSEGQLLQDALQLLQQPRASRLLTPQLRWRVWRLQLLFAWRDGRISDALAVGKRILGFLAPVPLAAGPSSTQLTEPRMAFCEQLYSHAMQLLAKKADDEDGLQQTLNWMRLVSPCQCQAPEDCESNAQRRHPAD